jgi:hypothetical protein
MMLRQAIAAALKRGRIVRALLLVCLALDVAGIVTGAAQWALLARAASPGGITDAEANANDLIYGAVGVTQAGAFVACAIAWLVWMHRSYANLALLGDGRSDQTPGWAVGYWFIPIVNLWKPYQLTLEMWRRNATGNRGNVGPVPALFVCWWALWIAQGVLGRVFMSLARNAETIPALQTMIVVGVFKDCVGIAGAAVAWCIVSGIDRMQGAAGAAQEEAERAAAAASPDPAGGIPTL